MTLILIIKPFLLHPLLGDHGSVVSRGRRVVRRMGSISSLLHIRRKSIAGGSHKSKASEVDVRPLNEHDTVSLDKFKLDQVINHFLFFLLLR